MFLQIKSDVKNAKKLEILVEKNMKRLGVFDDDIIIILNFSISQKNGERTYKHTEHANKRANEHKNEHMNEPHPKKLLFMTYTLVFAWRVVKKDLVERLFGYFPRKK